MMIADEHIAEFQMLYKRHFGADISKEDALAKGIRLVRLMEVVLRQSAKDAAEGIDPSPVTK